MSAFFEPAQQVGFVLGELEVSDANRCEAET
jgi:hypothetical protein